jgi:hypothetical protein
MGIRLRLMSQARHACMNGILQSFRSPPQFWCIVSSQRGKTDHVFASTVQKKRSRRARYHKMMNGYVV